MLVKNFAKRYRLPIEKIYTAFEGSEHVPAEETISPVYNLSPRQEEYLKNKLDLQAGQKALPTSNQASNQEQKALPSSTPNQELSLDNIGDVPAEELAAALAQIRQQRSQQTEQRRIDTQLEHARQIGQISGIEYYQQYCDSFSDTVQQLFNKRSNALTEDVNNLRAAFEQRQRSLLNLKISQTKQQEVEGIDLNSPLSQVIPSALNTHWGI